RHQLGALLVGRRRRARMRDQPLDQVGDPPWDAPAVVQELLERDVPPAEHVAVDVHEQRRGLGCLARELEARGLARPPLARRRSALPLTLRHVRPSPKAGEYSRHEVVRVSWDAFVSDTFGRPGSAATRQGGAMNRREILKGAATLAVMPLAGSDAEAQAPAAAADPWRGLKPGVASYTLRKLPLDAAIVAIKRVGLSYVSIKDFHLKLDSTAEERKAVAAKFKEAGITPLSCGNITMQNDEADVR